MPTVGCIVWPVPFPLARGHPSQGAYHAHQGRTMRPHESLARSPLMGSTA